MRSREYISETTSFGPKNTCHLLIEEQQALYTRAKRREGALPDQAALNPKRRRIGNQTTDTIIDASFWCF
jgi:hypothetical protein